MREICTSGLRRGRERGGHWLCLISCVPLYSTSRSPSFRNWFQLAAESPGRTAVIGWQPAFRRGKVHRTNCVLARRQNQHARRVRYPELGQRRLILLHARNSLEYRLVIGDGVICLGAKIGFSRTCAVV